MEGSSLNMFQRILSIVILAIVVFFLMKPISFNLPVHLLINTHRKFSLTLDLAVVPVVGILVLLVAGSITWEDIVIGIVGDSRLQPYAVIILFFAIAYLCLSLDVTGIFDWIAVKTILSAQGSGKRLFVALFVLSTILTVSTSNDIVILTLTQIILSLSKITKCDPLPFLILEFFMANIWSAFFLIGNATNIIVAQAYGISFVEYLKWMALPTVFAGFTAFTIIWFRFRGLIPDTIPIPDINPDNFFKDRLGGLIGTFCVIGRLFFLIVSGSIKQVPMWAITLIFAGIMLVRDIIYDFVNGRTLDNSKLNLENNVTKEKEEDEEVEEVEESSSVDSEPDTEEDEDEDDRRNKSITLTTITVVPDIDGTPENTEEQEKCRDITVSQTDDDNSRTTILPVTVVPNLRKKKTEKKKEKNPNQQQKRFVTPTVIYRLPWKIVPFLFSVFIIVQALITAGWTKEIAKGFANAIGTKNSSDSAAAATYLLGGVASGACNILNNQPMTILFTRVLADSNYTVAPRPMGGSIFGLILGSNFGANITPVGALAGIMWYAILDQKGYKLGFFKFVTIGCTIMPSVILISCGILAAELSFFPSDFSSTH